MVISFVEALISIGLLVPGGTLANFGLLGYLG
jgi:hypothetical protein